MRMKDKIAIVTGATGGIGRAIATRFVEEGGQVLLVDLAEAPLAALASELGAAAAHQAADVSDPAQVKGAVDHCIAHFGGVDVLVANAGIEGKIAPLVDQSEADFRRVLDINVLGAWYNIKYAAPRIAERGGGSIIVTASVASYIGSPGLGPYVASKHAVLGLVKTAAQELAAQHIRVNAVNPGPIANRMMDSIAEQASPGHAAEVRAAFEQKVPLQRYGTNEEVANLALFLASDESSYCTGAAYLVDGGMVSG